MCVSKYSKSECDRLYDLKELRWNMINEVDNVTREW